MDNKFSSHKNDKSRQAALARLEQHSDTCAAYVGQCEYRVIQHVLATVEVEI